MSPHYLRQFKFSKLLITTIVPIIPLVVIFDGLVSVLRSYTPREIKKMFLDAEFGQCKDVDTLAKESAFKISAGTYRVVSFYRVTYFHACRKNVNDAD